MVDISADNGWLWTTLNSINLMQMVMQGQWLTNSTLRQLPYVTDNIALRLWNDNKINSLPLLLDMYQKNHARVSKIFNKHFRPKQVEKIMRVMSTMPVIDMNVRFNKRTVEPDEECKIDIYFKRRSKRPTKGIYAPKFPKIKEEAWWVVLGDTEDGELLALKRVAMQGNSRTSVIFDAPEDPGEYTYQVYFLSDSYIGLDQQYPIKFVVK
mmetsp:Transcript_16138/g.17948  ORF Transcript_16138/g.17948 Transcript_16138/m.17948 type:complete len:210 (-) Transcript_16138:40-669(-)